MFSLRGRVCRRLERCAARAAAATPSAAAAAGACRTVSRAAAAPRPTRQRTCSYHLHTVTISNSIAGAATVPASHATARMPGGGGGLREQQCADRVEHLRYFGL